jgi:hypothetical protein
MIRSSLLVRAGVAAVSLGALVGSSACNAVTGVGGFEFDLGAGGGGAGGGPAGPNDPGTLGAVGHFGGDGAQTVRGAAVTTDGAAVLAGSFEGTVDFGGGPMQAAGGTDVFLAKLGPHGNHLWSRRFGSRDGMTQEIDAVALDAGDGIYAVGSFDGSLDFGGDVLTAKGDTGADAFVVRLDGSGNHVFSKRFGDDANQYAMGVAVDPSGGVVLVGAFEGTVDFGGGALTSGGDLDGFVVKLDDQGGHVWSKRFGGAGAQYARAVTFDAAGHVVVVGDFEGTVDFGGGGLASAGDRDVFAVALDAKGKHLWSKRFGDAGRQVATSVSADPAGGVWLASDFAGSIDFGGGPLASLGSTDVAIASLDASGAHRASLRFGDDKAQSGSRVAVDAASEVTVTLSFSGVVDFGGGTLGSSEGTGLAIAKLDATGGHRWSHAWKGTGTLFDGLALAASPDRRVVSAGQFVATADFGRGAVKATSGSDAFAAFVGP